MSTPDLSKPFTPLSLTDLILSYTDTDAIANEKDPLKRALMVTMAFGDTQAKSLQLQNDITKNTTDQLELLNTASGWLNNAAARTANSQDTDTTWVGPTQFMADSSGINPNYEITGQQVIADLTAAGVDPATIGLQKLNQNTNPPNPDPVHTTTVRMDKRNIAAASKNVQLKVDTISADQQEDTTFVQMLVGRYSSTEDAASAFAKKRADLGENIIQNLKKR